MCLGYVFLWNWSGFVNFGGDLFLFCVFLQVRFTDRWLVRVRWGGKPRRWRSRTRRRSLVAVLTSACSTTAALSPPVISLLYLLHVPLCVYVCACMWRCIQMPILRFLIIKIAEAGDESEVDFDPCTFFKNLLGEKWIWWKIRFILDLMKDLVLHWLEVLGQLRKETFLVTVSMCAA